MSASPEVAAICDRLFNILSESKSHYDVYFAGLARSLGLVAAVDINYAAPLYQSLDWWGGSGSFADGAGMELPRDQRKEVLRLTAELRDVFHQGGMDYPRADRWSETFRSWLRDGVLDARPS